MNYEGKCHITIEEPVTARRIADAAVVHADNEVLFPDGSSFEVLRITDLFLPDGRVDPRGIVKVYLKEVTP